MIIIKSRKEIEKIRASCIIVTGALEEIKKKVRSGITTRELDRIAEEFIVKNGGTPAFKGYRGYPSATCISVNEEIVHGIPSDRELKDGDIVSIDIGVKLDGYYGDAAITVPVNEIDSESKRLLDVTERSLYKALDFAKAGNRVSDISCTIQDYVEKEGYSVVRDFVGHGIGSSLHEDAPVPNYGERGKGPRCKAGRALAIEPMVNAGGSDLVVFDNGWAAGTRERKRSAHFEHTVAITEDGHEILSML